MRHARLMALFGNAYRDREKHPQPFSAADFMPSWSPNEQLELTEEELFAKSLEIFGALGGVQR